MGLTEWAMVAGAGCILAGLLLAALDDYKILPWLWTRYTTDHVAEWRKAQQHRLTQLPNSMPPEHYTAQVIAGLKHKLPAAITRELERIIAAWYANQRVPSASEFAEQAKAANSRWKPIKPDYLETELDEALARSQHLRSYSDPASLTALLNQIFYHLPHHSMLLSEGKVKIRDLIPEEERYTYQQQLYAADPHHQLETLLDLTVGIGIPEEKRSQHTHLVGRSGSGKTTALEYMIAKDLKNPETSVIVVDSQGQMIPRLMALADIPPERYCILNAGDTTHPIAINPFAIAGERLKLHNPHEREQLTNTVLELYEWMFSSIMEGSELTGKQGGLFGYVCRLLINVPGATLLDMVEILRNGTGKYSQYVAQLSPAAQAFFKTEFMDKEYQRTKSEVLRRLFQLMQNDTFAKMFLQPDNKVDLFTEMQQGKLILVNTSLAHLRETGSRVFGRFIIALTQMAVEERMLSRETSRCYLYIDEFQEVLSSNIAKLLEQSRKSNLGLILSHQGLYQLDDARVAGAIRTNTAIKMVGDLDAGEEAVMARSMRCTPEQLRQPVGTFFTYVAGSGHAPIAIPEDYLSTLPQRTSRELNDLLAQNRKRYAATKKPQMPSAGAGFEDPRTTTL